MSKPGSEVVSVRQFPMRDLEPADFERFCALVVAMDFPESRRLEAPDGGADAILDTDTGDVRVWQFKRFRDNKISWAKCRASLAAAVTTHAPEHVTFCFARDLTALQRTKFEALKAAQPGVRVDYWDATTLVSKLTAGPQGERIARQFFQDPSATHERLMAAIRAGNALETGNDVDRVLGALGSFAASHDPYFSYRLTSVDVGDELPSAPDASASVAISDGVSTRRYDAIPRSRQAREDHVPLLRVLSVDDTPEARAAAQALDRVMRDGGTTELGSGVQLELTRLPPMLQRLVALNPDWKIVVSSSGRKRVVWPARFVAELDGVPMTLDVDLVEEPPPDGWDFAFRGTFVGLEIGCAGRSLSPGGELQWTYTWTSTTGEVASDALLALEFAMALRRDGVVRVEDRSGQGATTDFETTAIEPIVRMEQLRGFLRDVVTLEEWTGQTVPVPSAWTGADAEAIADAADMVRVGSGERRASIGLVMPPADNTVTGMGDVKLEVTWELHIFGLILRLGQLVGSLPTYEITSARTLETGEIEIEIAGRGLFHVHRVAPDVAPEPEAAPL